jgi:hypothetical protein
MHRLPVKAAVVTIPNGRSPRLSPTAAAATAAGLSPVGEVAAAAAARVLAALAVIRKYEPKFHPLFSANQYVKTPAVIRVFKLECYVEE